MLWYRYMNLYIANILPLSSKIRTESLSYFSSIYVAPGMIVSVPIRKKNVPALVIEASNLADQKGKIKDSAFMLKKIDSILLEKPLFQDSFLVACQSSAQLLGVPTGSILSSYIPDAILKQSTELAAPTEEDFSEHTIYTLQSPLDQRTDSYKSLIREYFAKKKSIIIVTPTIQHGITLSHALSKGIESKLVILASGMTPKKILEIWNNTTEREDPVCIITTPSFLSLPRHDVGCIIIEKENSPLYVSRSYPYNDTRLFLIELARAKKCTLICADTWLSVDSIYRGEEDVFPFLVRPVFTTHNRSDEKQIITTPLRDKTTDNYSLLPKETLFHLHDNLKKGKSIFLYVLRRGISGNIICKDCATVQSCVTCKKNFTLYESTGNEERRTLRCHGCKSQSSAHTVCSNCQSWELGTLTHGTQWIEQVLKKVFPKTPIISLDSTVAPTKKKSEQIIKKFKETKGILIGTEKALSFIDENVDTTVVTSIDALFSIPSYRISEKILSLLGNLLTITNNDFIIQTQLENNFLLENFTKGNMHHWYEKEIEDRKTLLYPPFSHRYIFTLTTPLAHKNKILKQTKSILDQIDFKHTTHSVQRKNIEEITVTLSAPRTNADTLYTSPPDEFQETVQSLTSLGYIAHIDG
ncbi:MAG: primosomal protein N' [Flavobacteriaceae bacterium]|jgi:primosomal protein N'